MKVKYTVLVDQIKLYLPVYKGISPSQLLHKMAFIDIHIFYSMTDHASVFEIL